MRNVTDAQMQVVKPLVRLVVLLALTILLTR